jgi:uncharacterized repeat protein (TIGR03837 family)
VDNPVMPPEMLHPTMRWDIFCRVIDNYGDIGVCWRLACNLAQLGQSVRLWTDDASALSWIAPDAVADVQVRPWTTFQKLQDITPGNVLIEAFGCQISPEFVAAYVDFIKTNGQKCLWINLEYLSAEPFARRCHGLPSPVMSGPGTGMTKYFFYPGFTADTGGLLREQDLLDRQARFDRADWLKRKGVDWQGQRLVSLFCYEPPGLGVLLDVLATQEQPTFLLVTTGRACAAIQSEIERKNELYPLWNKDNKLLFFIIPSLTQDDFDHLLWACDVNFVRGEDSLVRALWAGKPSVWQLYPQDDGAHIEKLNAYLTWLQAPPTQTQFHRFWNDTDSRIGEIFSATFVPLEWQACALQARERLLVIEDLATQLIRFCSKNH